MGAEFFVEILLGLILQIWYSKMQKQNWHSSVNLKRKQELCETGFMPVLRAGLLNPTLQCV